MAVPEETAEARVFALVKAVVRALSGGNGRSGHCNDEEELRQRLDQDGVVYDAADLAAALAVLENNGEGAYDTGALPGIPYRLIGQFQITGGGPTQRHPTAPRLFVLKYLRPY